MVRYLGLGSIKPSKWLLDRFFRKASVSKHKRRNTTIIGPFGLSWYQKIIIKLRAILGFKVDFFVTGENRPPRFDVADKQIGFWRSYKDRSDVLRFPNWMWHLDWPGLVDQPEYPRYGMRLSIDRLLSSIEDTYGAKSEEGRRNKAVLFTGHLREPRNRLYQLVNETLGCDGYGRPFGTENKQAAKMPVLEQYVFCLCPENSLGDGYVTEKIPEAFHAGCIPITWCRPEDLAEDFNSEAVVNLYGLDDTQVRDQLLRLATDTKYVTSLRRWPLLRERPSPTALEEFILE